MRYCGRPRHKCDIEHIVNKCQQEVLEQDHLVLIAVNLREGAGMSKDTRNSGDNTGNRNADGTFAVGNPGKPKGTRNRATRAIEKMLEGQSEALTQVAIDKALDGDTTALRLCLDRTSRLHVRTHRSCLICRT